MTTAQDDAPPTKESAKERMTRLRAVTEADAEAENARELMPSPGKPLDVARKLVAERVEDGASTVRSWRGGWMKYVGPHWREVEEAAMSKWVYERLETAEYAKMNEKTGELELRDWAPNKGSVANVLHAMSSVELIDHDTEAPSWLDDRADHAAYLACTNGLLDVQSRELRPATPRYFTTISVPFAYDPAAAAPTEWLTFLRTLWKPVAAPGCDPATCTEYPGFCQGFHDAEEVTTLQDWFGYVLSGRTNLQKILLMVGPKRGGKGTIARILTALLGDANVAGMTMAALGKNFGLQEMIGKPLGVIGDARVDGSAPGNAEAVERLLQISGEDKIQIDRKNRAPWSGRLPTRLVVLSNVTPRLNDPSGALPDRFIVLTTTESFLGREDVGLEDRLIAELPSILKWGLDGMARVLARRRISTPSSSEDVVESLHDLASPAAAFIRDRCEVGPTHWGTIDQLFNAWRTWCEDSGHLPGSKATFSSNLQAAQSGLKVVRPHGGQRRMQGIGVRSMI